ncbi:hypothetical protein [Halovenus marina]|uniref:hypothetical protein n=1 Tax=Halovenus marina TaxID=3396621 RepID=UPI003F5436B4
MIVVATEDFEVYHEVLGELRDRDVTFTTVEPGAELPAATSVLITTNEDDLEIPEGVTQIETTSDAGRAAVEEALAALRGEAGRTVIGIDPGENPGIAVLVGETVIATFQVPPERVADVVHEQLADESDPLVRIGDGARLIGARIIDDLDVPVELVDETGTTPYLGAGARGLGDVLAAVNIARREGERVESREVDPTPGEIQQIRERSRERSERNRAIDGGLARQVAVGELTIDEALEEHRTDE